MIDIFNKEVTEDSNFLNNINQKIIRKKKEYKQLKHLETEINDYTNERDLQLLSNVNKNKVQELIILIIFFNYILVFWYLSYF